MMLSKINYDSFSSGYTVDARFDTDNGYTKVFRKFDTQAEAFLFISQIMEKGSYYDPFEF